MPSGSGKPTSPSIVRVLDSTCRVSLSFATPGRSARSVMPVLSSMTSTGGIKADPSRCAASFLRCTASLRGTPSFLVTAVVSFMSVLPGSLNTDAPRPRRFAPLGADVQDAIAIVRRHAIRIDVVGQAHDAPEPAAEPFVDVDGGLAVVLGGKVRLPLAGNGQHSTIQVDFDRCRIEPGGGSEDLDRLRRAA